MTRKPTIYLDANIIRDVIHRRNPNSISWVKHIGDKKWPCMTSIFGYMEIVDGEQDDVFLTKLITKRVDFNSMSRERSQRELGTSDLQDVKSGMNKFLINYSFIEAVSLTADGWQLALHISANSNIFAPDAIHLATAWQNNCDLMITSDSQLLRESKKLLQKERVWSKMKVCSPETVRKTLSSLHFGGLT